MIQPQSVQRVYDEFWSFDPAIVQPPEDPPEDADEKVKADHKAQIEEWRRRLEVARETGSWESVLVAGKLPTRFQLRPIPGQALRAINARIASGELDMIRTAAPLAFRACIVKIENPSIEVKQEQHVDYGRIATVAITDKLDAIDMSIVTEIGMMCLSRGTQGLSPKS